MLNRERQQAGIGESAKFTQSPPSAGSNDDTLTATKFLSNPFTKTTAIDLQNRRCDGTYLTAPLNRGCIDDQVKSAAIVSSSARNPC